jgi:hypothetical protein
MCSETMKFHQVNQILAMEISQISHNLILLKEKNDSNR